MGSRGCIDAPIRIARIGETLEAPGILRNPVPVSALYDPDEAQRLALRNLLQREGYDNLQAVKEEGRNEGLDQGLDLGQVIDRRSTLWRLIERRKLVVSAEDAAKIDSCADRETLERWHDAAIDAASLNDILK